MIAKYLAGVHGAGNTCRMQEHEALAMFDSFVNGRLGKDEWTHEAHLATCWVALRERTPAETLAYLRQAIQTHNCGIGVANTDTSGYHETLTVYYVTAVAQAAAADLPTLFADDHCGRKAPLEYWSRDLLFGTEARKGWVPPDLAELPWAITIADTDTSTAATANAGSRS